MWRILRYRGALCWDSHMGHQPTAPLTHLTTPFALRSLARVGSNRLRVYYPRLSYPCREPIILSLAHYPILWSLAKRLALISVPRIICLGSFFEKRKRKQEKGKKENHLIIHSESFHVVLGLVKRRNQCSNRRVLGSMSKICQYITNLHAIVQAFSFRTLSLTQIAQIKQGYCTQVHGAGSVFRWTVLMWLWLANRYDIRSDNNHSKDCLMSRNTKIYR